MENLATKTKTFIDLALEHDLPKNAYRLILYLFKVTVLQNNPDTGRISNDKLAKQSGIKKGSFGRAAKELKEAGLLITLNANKYGCVRLLNIPSPNQNAVRLNAFFIDPTFPPAHSTT